MKTISLDHLVLTVQDIQTTCDFYTDILHMKVEEFNNSRIALSFGDQKINLHESCSNVEPRAGLPTFGSADLCFISNTDMQEILRELSDKSIQVIAGPVERTGANGKIMSVYFRDPDLNLIEIANCL